MGLISFLTKNFVDVVQWNENSDGVLAYRYPFADQEIQYGATLVVRDSQVAMFIDEGRIADIYDAGSYELTTRTMPLLTNLKNWDKAFESPFKSDVYYFSSRLQTGKKWGTAQPITIRDKDFGMIRMRAFGGFSYKLVDVEKFFKEVSGTKEIYTSGDLEPQLKNEVISTMSALFGGSQVPFLDMAANQIALAETIKQKLVGAFARYGLELDTFTIESISLPEELQKTLDKKISMNMVGDLSAYTQYQMAESMADAAQNPSGSAGEGAAMAMGMVMAQNMVTAMQKGNETAKTPAPAAETNQPEDVVATIEKLHGLVAKGILSEEDFNAKKNELLKRL